MIKVRVATERCKPPPPSLQRIDITLTLSPMNANRSSIPPKRRRAPASEPEEDSSMVPHPKKRPRNDAELRGRQQRAPTRQSADGVHQLQHHPSRPRGQRGARDAPPRYSLWLARPIYSGSRESHMAFEKHHSPRAADIEDFNPPSDRASHSRLGGLGLPQKLGLDESMESLAISSRSEIISDVSIVYQIHRNLRSTMGDQEAMNSNPTIPPTLGGVSFDSLARSYSMESIATSSSRNLSDPSTKNDPLGRPMAVSQGNGPLDEQSLGIPNAQSGARHILGVNPPQSPPQQSNRGNQPSSCPVSLSALSTTASIGLKRPPSPQSSSRPQGITISLKGGIFSDSSMGRHGPNDAAIISLAPLEQTASLERASGSELLSQSAMRTRTASDAAGLSTRSIVPRHITTQSRHSPTEAQESIALPRADCPCPIIAPFTQSPTFQPQSIQEISSVQSIAISSNSKIISGSSTASLDAAVPFNNRQLEEAVQQSSAIRSAPSVLTSPMASGSGPLLQRLPSSVEGSAASLGMEALSGLLTSCSTAGEGAILHNPIDAQESVPAPLADRPFLKTGPCIRNPNPRPTRSLQETSSMRSIATSSKSKVVSDSSMDSLQVPQQSFVICSSPPMTTPPFAAGRDPLLQRLPSSVQSPAASSRMEAFSTTSSYLAGLPVESQESISHLADRPFPTIIPDNNPSFRATQPLERSSSMRSVAESSRSEVFSDSSMDGESTSHQIQPLASQEAISANHTGLSRDAPSFVGSDSLAYASDPQRSISVRSIAMSSASEVFSDSMIDYPGPSPPGSLGAVVDLPTANSFPLVRHSTSKSRGRLIEGWVASINSPVSPHTMGAGRSNSYLESMHNLHQDRSAVTQDDLSGNSSSFGGDPVFFNERNSAQSAILRSLWEYPTPFSKNGSVTNSSPNATDSAMSRSKVTSALSRMDIDDKTGSLSSVDKPSRRTAVYSSQADSVFKQSRSSVVSMSEDPREVPVATLKWASTRSGRNNPNHATLTGPRYRLPFPRTQAVGFEADLVSLRRTDSINTMDVDATTDEEDDVSMHYSPLSQILVLSDHPETDYPADFAGPTDAIPPSPQASASLSVSDKAINEIYQDLLRRKDEAARCGDIAQILKVAGKRPRRTPRSSNPSRISASTISAGSRGMCYSPRSRSTGRQVKGRQKRNSRRPRPVTRVMIARDVRAHGLEIMGREKKSSPITSVMLSRIERWVASGKQERYGPHAENFELFLDFEHVSPEMRPHCNAWNLLAVQVFVEDFLIQYPECRIHESTVLDCFTVHIKQLRNQFKKLHSATDEETQVAALRAKKIQSRRSLCYRRVRTLKAFQRGNGKAMERLVKMAVQYLDWKCCSGDETDTNGGHAITRLFWRSDELTRLFRLIDLLALSLRFPDGVHPTSGRFPFDRYDPRDKVPAKEPIEDPYHSTFVPGLPSNFYDPAWLGRPEELRGRRLDMTEAVRLKLPECLVRLAATALPVRNKDTQPFPRDHDV